MATLQAGLKPLFNKTYNRYSKDLKDKYIITTDNSGNITGKVSVGSLLSKAKYSGGYIADGVIVTQNPQAGDILFLDGEGIRVFVKNANDELIKANLPESWTLVGYVFHRGKTDIITGETDDLNQVWIVNKDSYYGKWQDMWQFAITAISSTSITIGLRLSTTYSTNVVTSITLSSTELNATTASEISTAIRAKAAEVSSAGTWWAYYDEANDRIIVQNDVNNNVAERLVTGTGCTIRQCTLDGMEQNNIDGWRKDGGGSGIVNSARGITLNSTKGYSDTSLGLTGNIMSRSAFNNSENSDVIAYKNSGKTYEDYIREYKMLAIPQPTRQGVFTLPVAKILSQTFAYDSAPAYGGGTKYKFPVMKACAAVQYDSAEFSLGSWWLAGMQEMLYFMCDTSDNDYAFTKLQSSATKMGTYTPANNVGCWLAQSGGNSNPWIYSGWSGNLNCTEESSSSYICQAVTCLYL